MKTFHASAAMMALLGASALGAEPTKLTCEERHPRLGQNPDRVFVVDLEAKTCNG